ncbi:endonuclease/exonuclease/phosphatase family protein [Maribellus maritimus]|uniref:endonuclease/exonuclease/phosphatase family protein n=1 Tax=Maribellus maritimus TaxID=2870838 RepID=UPI001EEBAE12|nr:endonuclease/exonuclease/phosphatase family protein [Maribellus maritimus]MCG6187493.1 endonuclease/exonuclease/phosphatase family protein [Maribellus maritimus]
MKKTLRYILTGLNILAVVCLLVSYLSIYIPPDKWWIPSFFGLAYPFILTANIFFIILWLLIKPKYMLVSLVAILIGWGFVSRYVQLKGKNIKKGDVKVLSYNVQYFNGEGGSQKKTADKIVDFLKEQNADIICLQEARLRKNSIFNLPNTVAKLGTINHYQFARSSTTYGSVTMTRFPIINMGEIRFENTTNMSIYTDVLIGEDTVRIFNVHLQSYQIDPNRYTVIDSPDFTEEENIREMREIGLKFKTAFQLRAAQVREIRKHIDASPYHVLVCGDFNDTPASFSYQKLRGKLKDAFVISGKGIGRTYVGKLPSFRIDNIFYSTGFQSFNFKTYDFRLSDHLPVSCELIKN